MEDYIYYVKQEKSVLEYHHMRNVFISQILRCVTSKCAQLGTKASSNYGKNLPWMNVVYSRNFKGIKFLLLGSFI